MSIKFLIKNLKLLIAVTLLLTSCGNIDTQKKISTQLKGTNLPEVSIKKLSTNVSNLENKHVKKIKQNEIIKIENVRMYKGWPGFNAREIVCKNPKDSAWPNHVESDAGNNRNVLAKIAGITPAIFTLNGK